MIITIKKLDGQKENFDFDAEDQVSKIKVLLAEKSGIHTEQIRLIFHGRPMDNKKTLAESNVKAGSVIHMIMQMRGGRN